MVGSISFDDGRVYDNGFLIINKETKMLMMILDIGEKLEVWINCVKVEADADELEFIKSSFESIPKGKTMKDLSLYLIMSIVIMFIGGGSLYAQGSPASCPQGQILQNGVCIFPGYGFPYKLKRGTTGLKKGLGFAPFVEMPFNYECLEIGLEILVGDFDDSCVVPKDLKVKQKCDWHEFFGASYGGLYPETKFLSLALNSSSELKVESCQLKKATVPSKLCEESEWQLEEVSGGFKVVIRWTKSGRVMIGLPDGVEVIPEASATNPLRKGPRWVFAVGEKDYRDNTTDGSFGRIEKNGGDPWYINGFSINRCVFK